MKLKFKTQGYQTAAVQAVVDCFQGQPPASVDAITYRIDPGQSKTGMEDLFSESGFKNADLMLTETQLLENIQQVQHGQNLALSESLVKTKVAKVNLDVEMETGTGKTYCYIKTIFELNRRFGWSKFIIVVPSIAIREGVAKSLEITADHFLETYQKKARFFIYNSKQLHHLESFSSDAGNPNVFVICALKHSDNTISRRQEVGRGLRLSVNQHGDRMDHPATVHDVNELTVVASESYKDFVAALRKDISESLSARPRVADEAYFTGKVLKTATGDIEVTPQLAKQIYKYLLKHDCTDDTDRITSVYHEAKKTDALAALPTELAQHADQIFQLIDSVFSESQLPEIGDDRRPKKNPLNANFCWRLLKTDHFGAGLLIEN